MASLSTSLSLGGSAAFLLIGGDRGGWRPTAEAVGAAVRKTGNRLTLGRVYGTPLPEVSGTV